MAEKKAYPLRISAEVLGGMQRWADDDLRSLNAQIEYVLRQALREAGRLREKLRCYYRTNGCTIPFASRCRAAPIGRASCCA